MRRAKTHRVLGRVNPAAVSCFGEGVTWVYLSATVLLSPGKGQALPSSGRQSRQATTTAGLWFGMAAGTVPGEEGGRRSAPANWPISHRARQTFSFKVRTGLRQRRETLSVPKQAPGRSGPSAFWLSRNFGVRSVTSASCVVAAHGLLRLITDGACRLTPPRPPKTKREPLKPAVPGEL